MILRYWWVVLAGLLLGGATAVNAHGGGEIMIGREPVANHLVTVWMNPPQAKTNETIHITVGVADGETATAVLDANVTITVFDTTTGEQILTTPATTEQSVNKLFYETDFVIDQIGQHEIQVTLTKAGSSGQTSFVTDIEAGQRINWLWVGLIGIALIAVFTLWRAR